MRQMRLLFVDLILIAVSTVFALLLRDNFDIEPAHFQALWIYAAATLGSALVIFPLTGATRSVWRFTSIVDYRRVASAAILTVFAALTVTFAFNRLEGVSRSLPILQGLTMVLALIGARVLMRLRHARRDKPVQLATVSAPGLEITVLVAGYSKLTEMYLRTVAEFASNRIRVLGIIAQSLNNVGRDFHGYPVLGSVENIMTTLRDLQVHGITVDRIYVTIPINALTERQHEALRDVELASDVRVYFSDELFLLDHPQSENRANAYQEPQRDRQEIAFRMSEERLKKMAKRPYWHTKRALDFGLSFVLLLLLAPLTAIVALLVAIDVGWPITFWQQRPGLGGYPFRLFKMRTMGAAHDTQGRHLADNERVSLIGRFLRRTRLDEIPQLYNILTGEMSFVGPRPLLPVDQPAAYAARMLIRPGLTGWAQVNGGRYVSAADKAALDVWYVENASLWLDLKIFWATVSVVLFGERVDAALIARTWAQLHASGICMIAPPELNSGLAGTANVKAAA